MKKLLVAMSLILGFSGVANAGILIEPYLGYEAAGKVTSSTGDSKFDGTSVGARLAYKFPLFLWVGVDGSFGMSGTLKPDAGGSYGMKHNALYGVVGVNLPILFRVWAGYGFSDQVEIDSPTSSTVKGKSYKLGVGFTGLPFVSLNAEYIKGTADEVSAGGVTNSSPDSKSESIMLSVSLPLTF